MRLKGVRSNGQTWEIGSQSGGADRFMRWRLCTWTLFPESSFRSQGQYDYEFVLARKRPFAVLMFKTRAVRG